MKTEHREVIIVGAGPAGTTCAQRLAEDEIDVLILERRAIVGNPAPVSYTHLTLPTKA